MKRAVVRLICVIGAVFVISNIISAVDINKTSAVEPAGKMSSVYAYILNDYMSEYGVLSTNAEGQTVSGNGEEYPQGVVYGDLIKFNQSEDPYLTVFIADGENQSAACHIWRYNDEMEKAEEIASVNKRYDSIPDYANGEFALARNDDGVFVTHSTYENNNLTSAQYYTVLDGDAYIYVNNPAVDGASGIMYFNSVSFNAAVDISDYNAALDTFFSKLRNASAKSVTYENIAERVNSDDMTALSRVLIKSALYRDFDIADYSTNDEYTAALNETTSCDTYTRMTALYDLGDGIYYALFDTERSVYNYALLRKSDAAKNGYQILKVRTDCIPLADRELEQIKLDYMANPLLYELSLNELKLDKKAAVEASAADSPTVTAATDSDVQKDEASAEKTGLTVNHGISLKLAPDIYGIRFPAACIAGGIAIALLTLLWVYLRWD